MRAVQGVQLRQSAMFGPRVPEDERMSERQTLSNIAAALRSLARDVAKVNPAYAGELRARAAMHAQRALRLPG